MDSMKILLTNDDGIHAPGIVSLHSAIEDLGDVWTAAPLTVQSAAGHGITYTNPLMVEPIQVTPSFGGMAIDGKPAVANFITHYSLCEMHRLGASSDHCSPLC